MNLYFGLVVGCSVSRTCRCSAFAAGWGLVTCLKGWAFGKLPIPIQSQLTLVGKQNSSLDEIKQFITRQCQNEQFLAPMNAQPFIQVTNSQPAANAEQQPVRETEQPATKPKYRFTGECHYCGKIGHKAFECRTRKREERQQQNNEPEQQDAETKPKYNAKLVCQICGYTGHSAKPANNATSPLQPTDKSPMSAKHRPRTKTSAESSSSPTRRNQSTRCQCKQMTSTVTKATTQTCQKTSFAMPSNSNF